MTTKQRMVFELLPEEKAWIEGLVVAAGCGTNIQLFRLLLDREAKRIGYSPRPGALSEGRTERKPRGEVPEDIARILAAKNRRAFWLSTVDTP